MFTLSCHEQSYGLEQALLTLTAIQTTTGRELARDHAEGVRILFQSNL